MTTDKQTQTQETEIQQQPETPQEYFRKLYFEKDTVKDSWIILKEIKISKDQYQNLFLFSWHPSVIYSSDTVPVGLGLPRDYDQFCDFLIESKMTLLGKIAVSAETGEPILLSYNSSQLLTAAENVITDLLDPKILRKFVISQFCVDPDLWVSLNALYNRLMGSTVDLKQVTSRGVITPTLKSIGQYKKALKGAMDF